MCIYVYVFASSLFSRDKGLCAYALCVRKFIYLIFLCVCVRLVKNLCSALALHV
jgi:hypothetical protein